MRILRDESGHVLVMPFPFGRSKARDREHAELSIAPVAAATAQPVLRRVTMHCRFMCKWCNAQIQLPHDRMGLAFGQPGVRKIEARSIATVCRSCGHVSDYSLFRGCNGFDTRHRLIEAETEGETFFLDALRCEEPTCTFPVRLFATFEAGVNDDEKKKLASSWLWQDILCASNHPVRPPMWLFSSQSHQFPLGLK